MSHPAQHLVRRGICSLTTGLIISLVTISGCGVKTEKIGTQTSNKPLTISADSANTPITSRGIGPALTHATLDPQKPPAINFALTNWKITLPDATEYLPDWLTAGNEVANTFYTSPQTGAMVFNCPTHGSTTSSATKYSRTELREMLRGLNTRPSTKGIGRNNWVLSTAPHQNQVSAGGIDGTLEAVLSVDYVSQTGPAHMIGRVIVGQIHGEDDEPVRIYYRKLPHNTKGSVYFASEHPGGEDVFYPMIGSSSNSATDPEDGIALGEKWGYRIHIEGRQLSVRIIREDGRYVEQSLTIGEAYNNDWFYFKAGVYNQNNDGNPDEYAQASFFKLKATHKQYNKQ